jgi:hypothetical protein
LEWNFLVKLSKYVNSKIELAGSGTQTLGLGAGGYPTSKTNVTEEWTGEIATANSKTLTTS